MKPPLRVLALTKRDPQYGAHSGYYTQAFRFGLSDPVRVRTVTAGTGWTSRAMGKTLSLFLQNPPRNQAEQTAEAEFVARMWLSPGAVGHIANIEDHLPLARLPHPDQSRWVATIHFPAPLWREEDAKSLRRFGKIIVLCRRDVEAFSRWLPSEQIVFIPHGVDTTFFKPDDAARSETPRLLFVGKWLRHFDVAGELLLAAMDRWPQLQTDILVARKWVAETRLAALMDHPRVRWYDSVDDEALLGLYQAAWMLFMPVQETSANNALVEALACGTVPIINRVGGVVDYGGGDAFLISQANHPISYLALIEEYLNNPSRLAQTSRACREFAVRWLDWPLIRDRNRNVYEQISKL
jgi:glycosyltransferase involved in cell wall biosynthesis